MANTLVARSSGPHPVLNSRKRLSGEILGNLANRLQDSMATALNCFLAHVPGCSVPWVWTLATSEGHGGSGNETKLTLTCKKSCETAATIKMTPISLASML